MKAVKRIFLSVLTFFAFSLVAQAQCAMCRGSIESTVAAGDTSMASNLNLGILYLFVAPYLLLATLGYFWYRTSKRNGRKIKGLSNLAG